MTDAFVLLHAPALGPASWAPVATALEGAGQQVVVPALAGFTASGPPAGYQEQAAAVRSRGGQ